MVHLNQSILSQTNILNHSDTGPCTELILHTAIAIFLLISLSHLLHMIFNRFGQPSIVSQMLAGFLLGPIILNNINLLNKDMVQLKFVASTVSIFFMFLAGLEINISCLYRTIYSTFVVVGSNVIACVPITMLVIFLFCNFTNKCDNEIVFFLVIFLLLFNTASPTLIRVVNELKLTMTEIGRVAMSVALITDVVCIFILGLLGFIGMEKIKQGRINLTDRIVSGFSVFLIWAINAIIIRFIVKKVNKQNSHKGIVGIDVVFYLLVLVLAVSITTSFLSYDPLIGAFCFGLVIQRDGPTARTLIEQLSHIVYNFMLPIYFGVSMLQVDFHMMMVKEVVIMTTMMVLLGMVGKIGSTIIGAKYLGMSMHESMVLSFLLNVKGHVNLMIIGMGEKNGIWNEKTYLVVLISLFFNNVIAYPATTYFVHQMRQAIQYHFKGLEWLHPESELRILACIHSPCDLPMILDLIEISSGPNKCPFTPYILQLKELTSTITSTMLYHQLQDEDINDNIGRNHAQQVNVIIEKYIQETNINLHQLCGISCFDSMHKDLQNGVQEIQASLAIVPFHRKQRFDGKMGIGKADVRQFNINVLRHVPCSIGILVDRGMDKRWGSSLYNNTTSALTSYENMILDVVVLFLGGADDREAVAYAGRLALYSCINVTIVRFIPTFRQGNKVHCFTNSISSASNCIEMEIERENVEETFMSNFHDRYVATGIVRYDERMVLNSSELIAALSSMKGMYSLYIVGRQTEGSATHLTTGMKDWEECPELGSIGDLLASSDFMTEGSVLVIQQCRKTISTSC